MDSPSLKHEYSEIINNLNVDYGVIEALIEIIFELRKTFKYVYAKMFKYKFLYDNDENLEVIRNVIGDENAFCYVSQMDKMLLYYVPHTFTIKCKYAATMDDFYFALFTVHNDNSINDLILHENSRIKINDYLIPYDQLLNNFLVIQFDIVPRECRQRLPHDE
jgi:hypothetical protein